MISVRSKRKSAAVTASASASALVAANVDWQEEEEEEDKRDLDSGSENDASENEEHDDVDDEEDEDSDDISDMEVDEYKPPTKGARKTPVKSKSTSNSKPKASPETKTTSKSKAKPTTKTKSKSKSDSNSESESEWKSDSESEPESESEFKSKSTTKRKSTPKPKSKSKPTENLKLKQPSDPKKNSKLLDVEDTGNFGSQTQDQGDKEAAATSPKRKGSRKSTEPSKRPISIGDSNKEDAFLEAERTRLIDTAYKMKLFQHERPKLTSSDCLPLPDAFQQLTSGDILNKSTTRSSKVRFLFSLPIQLKLLSALSAADSKSEIRIGKLANLNTSCPILYIEFPNGRLKMSGTILYPRNITFMAIQYPKPIPSARKTASRNIPLTCKGTFDHLILFSDWKWVGTAEENPSELPLPLPAFLQQPVALSEDFMANIENPQTMESPNGKRRRKQALEDDSDLDEEDEIEYAESDEDSSDLLDEDEDEEKMDESPSDAIEDEIVEISDSERSE